MVDDNTDKAPQSQAKPARTGKRAATIDLKQAEVTDLTPKTDAPAVDPATQPESLDATMSAETPVTEAPAPQPATKRSIWPAALAAGLAGGLLAGGGLFGIGHSSMMQTAGIDRAPEIRGIADRLSALEAQRSRVQTIEANIARLDARLTAAEKSAGDQTQPTVGTDGARRDIDAVAANLAAMRQELDGFATSLRSLEGRKTGTDDQAHKTALDKTITELRSEIASRAKDGAGLSRAAGLAVAAATLKGAIDRGTPFTVELAAMRAMGVTGTDLDAVAAAADKGVATPQALNERFRIAARSVVEAATPLPADTADRVLLSLKRLVSVRATGEPAGDDVEAVVARLETRLGRADLAGALAEYRKLPDASKASIATFGKELEARVEADRLMGRIAAEVTRALAPRQ